MSIHHLRDGRSVLIRALRPDDKQTLVRGWAKLSQRSRYFRFLRAVRDLSEADLHQLTNVDQRDHLAVIAIDPTRPEDPTRPGEPSRPESPGLGVARWIRCEDDPSVAEFAITVLDSYQGLGLGTLLLAILAKTAQARSITALRGWIHPENRAMLHLVSKAGGTSLSSDSCIERFELRLGCQQVPDNAFGRALRQLRI